MTYLGHSLLASVLIAAGLLVLLSMRRRRLRMMRIHAAARRRRLLARVQVARPDDRLDERGVDAARRVC